MTFAKSGEIKMNYLVAGTWRELNAQGAMDNFQLEIEASSEVEARNIVHSEKYYSKYDHTLIETVIANFDKSKNYHALEAKHDDGTIVYISISAIDEFLSIKGNDSVFVTDENNKLFKCQRGDLSQFRQI